jgi:hypothetical protein
MSYKSELDYYEERLIDRNLLVRAIRMEIHSGVLNTLTGKEIVYRFYCVPCGGDRVTGFSRIFLNKSHAEQVYNTLLASGEGFPTLRIAPRDDGFYVKWGLDEPDIREYRGRPWDWEVAIAKQLGYNEECMAAHYERCHRKPQY